MPLRCIDSQTGQSLVAFEFGTSDWQELKSKNQRVSHLQMACCSAPAVLKTSKNGVQFFAHKIHEPCESAPETENHLHLKRMVVEAARANGWAAYPEVSGSDSEGQCWIADVLATRENHKVAVEIQWSGQTAEETLARQERYRRSGVRGLWLLRQPGFPVSKQLPAACIGGDITGGFIALIPEHQRMTAADRKHVERWREWLPMNKFLSAVFQRRFQYGLPENGRMESTIWFAELNCWHPSCAKPTTIIRGVSLKVGSLKFDLSVSDFTGREELLGEVTARIADRRDIGTIRMRWSQTQNKAYLSNGCRHCDRLVGEHFESRADRLYELTGGSAQQLTRSWVDVIQSAYPDDVGWHTH
jgi:hypothetical protein